MSENFDIRSSINRIIEQTMQTPEARAETMTRITMMLKIPLDLAASQESKGNELIKKLAVFNASVRDSRETLATVSSEHKAGKAEAYEVTDAEAVLAMHIAQRDNAMSVVDGISAFHKNITKMVNDILASV